MSTSCANRSMLPGPRPMPLLGALGNLIQFIRNPIGYMDHLYQSYGEVVSLARGTTKYVFVFGPEYNRIVLSNTALFFNLDANSSSLRIPKNSALLHLFSGLIQMNGARHKQQRQLMVPAFQKKRIENYYRDMVAIVEQKLAGWRVGQRRDLYQEMKELSLSIAVKTLVGLDPDRGGDAMCQLLERWMSLVFSLLSVLLPLNLPGLAYRRLLSVSEELDGVIRTLIERKRASGLDEGDLLSMLMQVHDNGNHRLTDDELVGHTNFLFFAGHTTTASALTWTLFLLDQHPRTLNDLLDELEGKLHGDAPTMEQLDEMPLLEAVILESMRLLPPVIWSSRISTAPFNLGQYELPCGTQVIHSAHITHRISNHFPQPKKFLPQRWQASFPAPYEYIPFSAGPRLCLGSRFAMVEMKLVLSMLLQRYRLRLGRRARVDFGGIMLSAPKKGMAIEIDQQDRRITRGEVRGNIHSVVDLN